MSVYTVRPANAAEAARWSRWARLPTDQLCALIASQRLPQRDAVFLRDLMRDRGLTPDGGCDCAEQVGPKKSLRRGRAETAHGRFRAPTANFSDLDTQGVIFDD